MKNFNVNVGGLIGAVVCGAAVGVLVYSSGNASEVSRGKIKLVIFGFIGGAFVGNYLWSLVFKKPEQESEDAAVDQSGNDQFMAADDSKPNERDNWR